MYALPRPVLRDSPKIITLLDAAVSSAYRFSKIFHGFGGQVEEDQWKLLQKWMKVGNTETIEMQLHAYSLISPVTLCPQPQRHNVWCPLRATVSHCQPTGGPQRWESPSLKWFSCRFHRAQNSHRRATQTSLLSYTLIVQGLKVQHNTLWSGISTWEEQTFPKTWSWPEGPVRYHSIQRAYLSFQLGDRNKNSTWNQDNILILLLMLC